GAPVVACKQLRVQPAGARAPDPALPPPVRRAGDAPGVAARDELGIGELRELLRVPRPGVHWRTPPARVNRANGPVSARPRHRRGRPGPLRTSGRALPRATIARGTDNGTAGQPTCRAR